MKQIKLILVFLLTGYFSAYAQPMRTDSTNKSLPLAPWFVDRFRVSGGYLASVNNTKVQIGNNSGSIGTDIDFENDLGFTEDKGTYTLGFQWRTARRSRLDFNYLNIHRSANYILKKNIEFEDHVYPVNATVNSYFNTDIYRFSYGYAFIAQPKFELGLSIGAHTLKTDVGVSAYNASGGGGVISDDMGFTAPLPNFGVWGGYAFSKRLALNWEFDYLSLDVEGVSGEIFGYNVSLMYRMVSKLDLSVGYSGFNFNVNIQTDKNNGYIDWGYRGPSIALAYSFGKPKWRHL
jgi:hypothetical protein